MGVEYRLDFTEKTVITVTLMTLDKIFDDLNLERVDLVKVDVQGAERELCLAHARVCHGFIFCKSKCCLWTIMLGLPSSASYIRC